MGGLAFLSFLLLLWFFIAPFMILGRLGDVNGRLNEIRDLKRDLETISDRLRRMEERSVSSRLSSHDTPVYTQTLFETAPKPTVAPDLPPVPEPEEAVYLEATQEENQEVENQEPENQAENQLKEEPAAVLNEEETPPAPLPSFAPPPQLSEEEPAFEGPPTFFETATKRLFSWLLAEGNIWVCVGVTLFFIGFGLLFNYAVQMGWLTIQMRLSAAAVTGIAMAAFGFRLREQRRTYALILQGGGMGILYLVVLGGSKFYAILPAAAAVVAMLLLAAFTVLLALLQDFEPLAVFALMGGYVAPILVSTGSRNHVALFSIYSLLNLTILLISLKRNWKILARTGFVLTVFIAAAWGKRDWRPELFPSVEPFLLAFLATWTPISLLTALRRDETNRSDLPLAASVPFAFFALQIQLMQGREYGMALTCLGLGAWYLLFGVLGLRRKDRFYPVIPRAFVSLCILFANLVVPYAFSNTASSAIWSVEGAFLLFAAVKYGSYQLLFCGLLLYGGALYLYFPHFALIAASPTSKLSPLFVSGLLFAASYIAGSLGASRFHAVADESSGDVRETILQRFLGDGEWVRLHLSWAFIVIGSFWLWGTVYDQVPRLGVPWLSAFSLLCLSSYLGCLFSLRQNWPAARFLLVGPLCAASVTASGNFWLPSRTWINGKLWLDTMHAPFFNTLAYLAGVGGSLYLLRRSAATLLSKCVFFAALSLGLLLSRNSLFNVTVGFASSQSWAWFCSTLPLVLVLAFLSRSSWEERLPDYTRATSLACSAVLLLNLLPLGRSFFVAGEAFGPFFIPFLNPLELGQISTLASMLLCVRLFFLSPIPDEELQAARAKVFRFLSVALLFLWVNQVAARATWWYLLQDAGLRFDLSMVLRTSHFQGVASILWGLIGLGSILYGKKVGDRALWSTGATLLAVDMGKLLLIDLNRAATLTRILAFLVLGGLFLLIGWAAPLPPKREAPQENNDTINDTTGDQGNA